MHVQEVAVGPSLLATLDHGEPLIGELEALAEAASIDTAWVVGAGAVQDATLGYYDQDEFVTETVEFPEPLGMPFLQATITSGNRHAGAERDADDEGYADDEEDADEKRDAGAKDEVGEEENAGAEDRAGVGGEAGSDDDPPGERGPAETEPHVRAQAVLARPTGQPLAGQLEAATVFGADLYVQTFDESIARERDDATDMDRLAL